VRAATVGRVDSEPDRPPKEEGKGGGTVAVVHRGGEGCGAVEEGLGHRGG